MEHTFVVCAYKESPYLERCVQSLIRQSVKSRLIIATSTPNKLISDIGEKYEIPVCVNKGETGLAGDWNYGYNLADTPLVTLAHQDDLYSKKYTENMLDFYFKTENPLIIFSDYCEYRNGKRVLKNRNLCIKRLLLSPLRIQWMQKSVFIRRRMLSLGNPICCPAVTYVKDNLPEVIFQSGMSSNSDWQAWERLSKMKGRFVYIPKPLMAHRIHDQSTTTAIIENSRRRQEDLDILKKFWPKPVAAMIEHFYVKSEKSNKV